MLLSAAGAHGQERVEIRGQVVDAESRVPLRGVLVTAPLSGSSVLTDSLGTFGLSFIEDLGYALVAEDLGYRPLRFTLGPEDRMIQSIPFVGPLQVSARVDSDGNAMSRNPGDMSGAATSDVEPGARGVDVTIDQVL